MPEQVDNSGLEGLIKLFNIADKSTVEKFSRNLIITREDLFQIILVGQAGKLEPYQYVNYFAEVVPQHLPPTDKDLGAVLDNA